MRRVSGVSVTRSKRAVSSISAASPRARTSAMIAATAASTSGSVLALLRQEAREGRLEAGLARWTRHGGHPGRRLAARALPQSRRRRRGCRGALCRARRDGRAAVGRRRGSPPAPRPPPRSRRRRRASDRRPAPSSPGSKATRGARGPGRGPCGSTPWRADVARLDRRAARGPARAALRRGRRVLPAEAVEQRREAARAGIQATSSEAWRPRPAARAETTARSSASSARSRSGPSAAVLEARVLGASRRRVAHAATRSMWAPQAGASPRRARSRGRDGRRG